MNAQHFDLSHPLASPSTAGWGLRACLVTAALWTAVLAFWPWEARGADESRIERSKHLVTTGGGNGYSTHLKEGAGGPRCSLRASPCA